MLFGQILARWGVAEWIERPLLILEVRGSNLHSASKNTTSLPRSLKVRASTKGWNQASVPVRRFLKSVFIRVHFVLRQVHSHNFLVLFRPY